MFDVIRNSNPGLGDGWIFKYLPQSTQAAQGVELKDKDLVRRGQLYQRRRIGDAALESRASLRVETDNALSPEQCYAFGDLFPVVDQSNWALERAYGKTIQIISRYSFPFNRFDCGCRVLRCIRANHVDVQMFHRPGGVVKAGSKKA